MDVYDHHRNLGIIHLLHAGPDESHGARCEIYTDEDERGQGHFITA